MPYHQGGEAEINSRNLLTQRTLLGASLMAMASLSQAAEPRVVAITQIVEHPALDAAAVAAILNVKLKILNLLAPSFTGWPLCCLASARPWLIN